MGRISTSPTAVALGLFDGVHLGHRHVLELVCTQKKNGLKPSVFTFSTESVGVKHRSALNYLYSTSQKCSLLRECGMEWISHHPFAEVCDMDGETFVQKVLLERFSAAYVCCGRDFRFGKGAACDAADLQRFGADYGFTVEIAGDVLFDGQPVSSSRIRRHLQNGEIGAANALLGAPYTIESEVVHGAQLGRTIGFPTINQVFAVGQLVPKFGVYASETMVDGVKYPSLTNIGMKPTVDYDGLPLAETHLIGYAGDLYGKTLQAALHHFLRGEEKFSSVAELTAQMHRDLERALQLNKE